MVRDGAFNLRLAPFRYEKSTRIGGAAGPCFPRILVKLRANLQITIAALDDRAAGGHNLYVTCQFGGRCSIRKRIAAPDRK